MARSRMFRNVVLVVFLALFASLAPGLMTPAGAAGPNPNPNESVTTSLTATQLASALVGAGVSVSNATLVSTGSAGYFTFADPSVVGFGQGLVLASGAAADVVGPNYADDTTTDLQLGGDPDLSVLSGFDTFDATILEFDFVPLANQVTFRYVFTSEEYPEYVNTPFNDVFAFFVNGVNCAVVRQTAGDPTSPFVPVAVNNINNSNPVQDPPPAPMRPDLFRANYFNGLGPSLVDLESDGMTDILICQSAVNPGVSNHMKLAIADSSDPILDSAVFIQAGSLVSNQNPVADLSIFPESGAAPLTVSAFVEGEDPDGAALTYSINWGDGTTASTGNLVGETTTVNHTFLYGGEFLVTLTVSNGTLTGTESEDVHVTGTATVTPAITTHPSSQSVLVGQSFTFSAAASGVPAPTAEWQVSTNGGSSYTNVPGATSTSYQGTAALNDNGSLYRAVFANVAGSATTNVGTLTVTAPDTTLPALAPTFSPAPPFLRGQTGITLSANASDASGIASQSCGAIDTSTVGLKSVTCSATDNAGNTGTATVGYLVRFELANVSPAPNTVFKRTAGIPVSFQLRDANGLVPDPEAATLRSTITVTFDGLAGVTPSYDKKRHEFSATLKTAKPAPGPYDIRIEVAAGGTILTTTVIPVAIG